MENNITSTEGQEVTQSEGIENPKDNQLPTTMEELQALLQKEGDKRVSQAQKKWQEKQKEILEAEKAEAAKLAKMSAAERERAKFDKERAEFEVERANFAKEQLKIQTTKELVNEGLPTAFVNYVLADNAEKINENIKSFKSIWDKALEDAVNQRITTPTPKKGNSSLNKTASNSFMDAINSKRVRR